MNELRTSVISRLTARVAALIAGLLLAVAVGAPFLLYDAPPSPEAVFAAKLCCAKAAGAAGPQAVPVLEPAR